MEFYNMITGRVERPNEWQAQLKIGDYYCIDSPAAAIIDGDTGRVEEYLDNPPPVFGQIIKKKGRAGSGYFWAKGFSKWCPDGEFGLMNICEPTRQLTEAEFNRARENGWSLPREE